MELVERMVAVEKEIEILNRETLRLRDAEVRVFTALEQTNASVARIAGVVENVQGTVHLIAENAAALAINRYKTEVEAANSHILSPLIKVVAGLVALVGVLIGVPHIPGV